MNSGPTPSVNTESQAWRGMVGGVVILASLGLCLGLTLRMPTLLEANDISRWCTVWALLERGSYAIDDCPWQARTQDKVLRPDPWHKTVDGGELKSVTPVKRFYSSKPPMLPTLVAGLLYPARQIVALPVDYETLTERITRNVRVEDKAAPGGSRVELQKPEPHKWSMHVVYLKPVLVLLNILPMALMLVCYRRFLDENQANDWAWLASLSGFAFGTYLTVFTTTLNNHLVAAWSAFFAVLATINAINDTADRRRPYMLAGFFAAFTACNELPAASLLGVLGLVLAGKSFRRTLTAYFPAALVPIGIFFACQYAALGTLVPAYAEFGGEAYEYPGSYWTTPLDLDYFDKHPEPRAFYLAHMLVGHHGIFSHTPIFIFAFAGIAARMGGRTQRAAGLGLATLAIIGLGCGYRIYKHGTLDPLEMTWLLWLLPLWLMLVPEEIDPRSNPGLALTAWATAFLSVLVIGFYGYKTNNYGGSTQGLRWLFWLIPLWIIFLPDGFRSGLENRLLRRLGFAALGVSFLSVGYGIRSPWTHPWMLDLLDRAGWYVLVR